MIVEKENRKRILQQSHGERIRSIRKQEGMTQERLADCSRLTVKP